jgi:hypothetical protein
MAYSAIDAHVTDEHIGIAEIYGRFTSAYSSRTWTEPTATNRLLTRERNLLPESYMHMATKAAKEYGKQKGATKCR